MKLIHLSAAFYAQYPHDQYPEILEKQNRPYACVLIEVESRTFAVPFRSNVQHEHSFKTSNGGGLDYTKAIPLIDPSFAAVDDVNRPVRIRQKDFDSLKGKEHIIRNGLIRYLKLYRKARLHAENKNYAKILKFSTLQYFDSYI